MDESELSRWSDLTPIPQDEGPDPVVRIAYEAEFVQRMDIFRAVLAKREFSERVLDLTYSLLELNPASYTVWQYRRECLRALKADLHDELDFMDTFSSENPKNYQIWYHRRVIVEMLGDSSRELPFCNEVYSIDNKNYHAWAHRQWVLQTFGGWDGELAFLEECINEDVRNNSAWNHRWFVVHNGPEAISEAILERELAFTTRSITEVKKNESSWNYLRGLARFHPELQAFVTSFCENIVKDSEEKNYLALGLLADLRESERTMEGLQRAKEVMEMLIVSDRIRVKSWMRRLNKVLQAMGAGSGL